MSAWSDEVVAGIADRFEAARDAGAAEPMAAYMKHHFTFLGISTKPREVLLRQALAGTPKPTERDLIDVTRTATGVSSR